MQIPRTQLGFCFPAHAVQAAGRQAGGPGETLPLFSFAMLPSTGSGTECASRCVTATPLITHSHPPPVALWAPYWTAFAIPPRTSRFSFCLSLASSSVSVTPTLPLPALSALSLGVALCYVLASWGPVGRLSQEVGIRQWVTPGLSRAPEAVLGCVKDMDLGQSLPCLLSGVSTEASGTQSPVFLYSLFHSSPPTQMAF